MQNQNRIIDAVRELSDEARESGFDDMAATLDEVLNVYRTEARVKPRHLRPAALSDRRAEESGSVVSIGPDRFVFGHRVPPRELAADNPKAVFRRSASSPLIQTIRKMRDNRASADVNLPNPLVLTKRVG